MVAEHDGRLVSAAALLPLPIVYGDIPLRAAYWEAVVTDEAYRRRGLCRRLLERLTPAEGPDVLFVWGLTWLYRRFGYYPALRNYGGLDSVQRVVRAQGLPGSTVGFRDATPETPLSSPACGRRRVAVTSSLPPWRKRFGATNSGPIEPWSVRRNGPQPLSRL